MLSSATYGYAMMNGSVTAKLAASYITKHTNHDDGVAKTLNYINKLIKTRVNNRNKTPTIDEMERKNRE